MLPVWSTAPLGVMLLALTTAVWAGGEKIPLDKVPKAALDAVKAKFPGSDLGDARKTKERGRTRYEIELDFKGHGYDVTVTSTGKIVVIEKEITLKELPKAVSKALNAKYPKAKVKSVAEVTEDDEVTYEVTLTVQGKELEAIFSPSGKFLDEELKTEKTEEKKGKKEK
jgi:hypothetical protein